MSADGLQWLLIILIYALLGLYAFWGWKRNK